MELLRRLRSWIDADRERIIIFVSKFDCCIFLYHSWLWDVRSLEAWFTLRGDGDGTMRLTLAFPFLARFYLVIDRNVLDIADSTLQEKQWGFRLDWDTLSLWWDGWRSHTDLSIRKFFDVDYKEVKHTAYCKSMIALFEESGHLDIFSTGVDVYRIVKTYQHPVWRWLKFTKRHWEVELHQPVPLADDTFSPDKYSFRLAPWRSHYDALDEVVGRIEDLR